MCDACGSDDGVEVIEKRLALFREQTQPLVRYYEQRGLLRLLDSSRQPLEAYAQVVECACGCL
jgi:adenylate kinase family enzyme